MLREKAEEFKRALKTADVGPTLIAKEIETLSLKWAEYESEAEGKSFKEWLKEISPTKYLHWWVRLAAATTTLGKPVAMKMHHCAVVYLVHSVAETHRAEVQERVLSLARRQGSAVSYGQLINIAKEIVPDELLRTRNCLRCDRLRRQLRALGVKPEA